MKFTNKRHLSLAAGLILVTFALFRLASWWSAAAPPNWDALDPAHAAPVAAGPIQAGTVAPMHSPVITYSDGWHVDASGADTTEPARPWHEPAGTLEFTYTGRTLALLIAPGNYWGYLYATVNGRPANRLAHIPGNTDSRNLTAGYTTLYMPERAPEHTPTGPGRADWYVIHETPTPETYTVRVEVWRSWGQRPIRGIAVDALPPPPRPVWPNVLAGLLGVALVVAGVRQPVSGWVGRASKRFPARPRSQLARLMRTATEHPKPTGLAAGLGTALVALAVLQNLWWLTWLGLLLPAVAGFLRPAYWIGALAFALPFYYSVTLPLLPGRTFGLIDVGLGLGLLIVVAHRLAMLLADQNPPTAERHLPAQQRSANNGKRLLLNPTTWLWALIGWALVSTVAAARFEQAIYEWRTIFLAAGMFWLLLGLGLFRSAADSRAQPTRTGTDRARGDLFWVVGCWLAGGAVVAGLAIGQYLGDVMLISAEGVARVRGLYGSPNNLALYLERTLMVSLGLALYLPATTSGRLRLALWATVLLQLVALILTFSKGALLLALPAGLTLLGLMGLIYLAGPNRSRRPLWELLGGIVFALLFLIPFVGTERFQSLLDLSQGTGFFRIQLWRSAWAMGLDNWLVGVGPDNFLYAFRSRYLLPEAWQDPDLNHPHNLFLDGLTRLGAPGLMLILTYLGVGVLRLWRGLHAGNRQDNGEHENAARYPTSEQALNVGFLAAAGAGLAHGLIDVSYALPDLILVWVLLFHLRRG